MKEKGGDIIYNWDKLPEIRGEMAELCQDAIFALVSEEPDENGTTRLSNGPEIDAHLLALDAIAKSERQRKKLRKFLSDYYEENFEP